MRSKDCTVVKDVESGFILEHGLPFRLPFEGIGQPWSQLIAIIPTERRKKTGRSMKCESPYHPRENSSAIFSGNHSLGFYGKERRCQDPENYVNV